MWHYPTNWLDDSFFHSFQQLSISSFSMKCPAHNGAWWQYANLMKRNSQIKFFVIRCSVHFVSTKAVECQGTGCGSVGRTVASDTRGPRFKSSQLQTLYYIFTVNWRYWKDEKKKRPGLVQFKKAVECLFTISPKCNQSTSRFVYLWQVKITLQA